MKLFSLMFGLAVFAISGLQGIGQLGAGEPAGLDEPDPATFTVCFYVDCDDGSGRKVAKGVGATPDIAQAKAELSAQTLCPGGYTVVLNEPVPGIVCKLAVPVEPDAVATEAMPPVDAQGLPHTQERAAAAPGQWIVIATLYYCDCKQPQTVGLPVGGTTYCEAVAHGREALCEIAKISGRRTRCRCYKILESP